MADFDFQALLKFLKHSDDEQLTLSEYLSTSGFPDHYDSLSVKIGFGKGNKAKVPWVAFIGYSQSVSKGIYPVLLYFREQNTLLLAYGLSATNPPSESWNFSITPQTIREYFKQRYLDYPRKYEKSYVFKSYIVNSNETDYNLQQSIILDDLKEITNQYIGRFNDPTRDTDKAQHSKPRSDTDEVTTPRERSHTIIHRFRDCTGRANLLITEDIVLRYVVALATKPFVILTGLSGSGKTKLAQAFASWICESEEQYRIIPVGADWTNREPLLGYPNALEPNKYVSPDCGSLDLILTAMKPENRKKPYFLILDEMNMSHVERYFADFLSAMESGEPIRLHSGKESYGNVPAEIVMPRNLFIVGTVNIDETTYMFSPKVLDRASVIEFRVTNEEMRQYLNSTGGLDMSKLKSTGASMAESFMSLTKQTSQTIEGSDAVLLEFFDELKKIGAEFGYRTAAEVIRFCNLVIQLDKSWTQDQIFDAAIMQKLLPKVHGSRRKLEPVLKTLGKICLLPNEPKILEDLFSFKTDLDSVNDKLKYPISLEKVLRMYRGLIDNGFTSYAEA